MLINLQEFVRIVFKLHVFILVYMCACTIYMVWIWGGGVRGLLVSQLSPSTIGVPRMRLKISGLAASIFAAESSCLLEFIKVYIKVHSYKKLV